MPGRAWSRPGSAAGSRAAACGVAPFKAQNMSNNSMVCADGAEIGRAQWLQARAARVEPEAAMNPVLLKPGSDRRSHVIALGRPFGTLEAGEYATGRAGLAQIAFDAFAGLSARFDAVVCEGAGSPAEINLRAGDYVNLGLARRFSLPVLVVGDIDRGGVLASMFGTLALLSPEDQALVAGWVVNKFRGDVGLLRPGLDSLEKLTGRPVLGVLPWLDRVWIDSEDALAVAGWQREARDQARDGARGGLRVAVVRFPRASNATDVDALAAEPGVTVGLTADPDTVAAADLVVLPGSRATVDDLRWLRERGLAGAVVARAAAGRPVLGICGGYQMLAESIEDDVESGAGRVEGLGLLPTHVTFEGEKVLGPPVRQLARAPCRRLRDPPRHRRTRRRGVLSGRSPRRAGVGHHLARRAGERRIPPGLAHGGRGPGRRAVVPGPGRAGLRRPARGDAGTARGRRRVRTGHREAVVAAGFRGTGRAAVRPARRTVRHFRAR